MFCPTSCDEQFNANEVCGTYASVAYKNTFDTIELNKQAAYHRKVYDKNNKLVYEASGRWGFESNHTLKISGFYLNLDDDLGTFPETVEEPGASISTYFETQNGVIQFCVGYHKGENCYKKIK